MRKLKGSFALVLALVLMLAAPGIVFAASISFTDVSGHWAWTGGQIPYLVEKNVLNGYTQPDGTSLFKPDATVKRSEFIKMLDETFGLTDTVEINYSDISDSDWYSVYFAKAAAQGYILDYGSKADPEGEITREEAISLLVRYLDLPVSDKAPSSTFSDYESISSDYRQYILMASAAGIVEGYNINGEYLFKPQNTLKRAEALTILYRAAGSIFNGNASARDNNAAEKNNVITKSDIILNKITFEGRSIISEGVKDGLVSIKNSKINDTLYIRGSADVTLEDCIVDTVVIDNGCKLSIIDGTSVERIIVNGKSVVNVYSGTFVDTLESYAEGTNVFGSGSVNKICVYAKNFKSTVVPEDYEIAPNLTAVFGSDVYSGSSTAETAFSSNPFITTDGSYSYLNVLPTDSGRVYYYYTNSGTTPSSEQFDSFYANSRYSDSFNVTSGKAYEEKTFSTSATENLSYIAVQLQSDVKKYSPVVIENIVPSGTGFSSDPELNESKTAINFTAKYSGTIFCYYTESSTPIKQAEFIKTYNAKESALKASNSVDANKSGAFKLTSNYTSKYGYVAFMLQSIDGLYYEPVVISVGDTGFSVEPFVKSIGVVSFTAKKSGTVYFYYTKSADNIPSATEFESQYKKAPSADKVSATADRATDFNYNTSYTDAYPYLIIALKTNNGYCQPVALSIDATTGFRNDPEIDAENEEIIFQANYSGTVYFYYSNSRTLPASNQFDTYYANAKYASNTYVSANAIRSIPYNSSYAATYPYLVMRLTDKLGKNYTPVIVSLDASKQTGFSVTPTVDDDSSVISFKPSVDGDVYYFYSTKKSVLSSSEFESQWNRASSSLRDAFSVSANSLSVIDLDPDLISDYPFVHIAICGGSNNKFYTPVVVYVNPSNLSRIGSGLDIDVLTGSGNSILFSAKYAGKLYWYTTDEAICPSSSQYASYYRNASTASYITLGRDDINTSYVLDFTSRNSYIVLCLTNTSGTYLAPVIVDLNTRKVTENTGSTSLNISDGTTTAKTGIRYTNDRFNKEITIMPEFDGTLKISIDQGFVSEYDTIEVEAGKEYTVSYEALASNPFAGERGISFVFQLKSGGTVYSSVKVPIN